MKFDKALELMKQGEKVKLPSWGGYWYWNNKKQTIMMQCHVIDSETGKDLLDIRETQRVEFTIQNILSDEWMIATKDNCTVLGGEVTFGFEEALKYIKRGIKVRRKVWVENDCVGIHKMHIECVNEYKNLISFYINNKTIMANWTPKNEDMLAEDWCFLE